MSLATGIATGIALGTTRGNAPPTNTVGWIILGAGVYCLVVINALNRESDGRISGKRALLECFGPIFVLATGMIIFG